MNRAARAMRMACGALAWLALTSCSGETVRLGDGFAGANAITSGGGGAAQAASGGLGGSLGGGSATCERGTVSPAEVLWIGDSWVTIPGTQHDRVRDLARAAGALAANDDYVVLAAPAASISDINGQYNSREASATKVKVVIMDGGTWDTLTDGGSPTSVTKATAGFNELLGRIASDGTVEHIIYYLVPELPTIAGVAALRPHVMQACSDSSVSCYFLDLQPLWSGHPEYTASDGIQASDLGAAVIADQIWAIMQAHCIAQ